MNKEELKKIEKECNLKVRNAYEEYLNHFINKYYKIDHKKGDTTFDHDQTYLLHTYGVSNQSISGIEFRNAIITRVGVWSENINDKNWIEITKEEFNEHLKDYIESFHLDDLLKSYFEERKDVVINIEEIKLEELKNED